MRWLQNLLARRQHYSDLSEEIRQHLEEKTDDLIQTGMSRREAEAAARREFGNLASLEETSREIWQWPTVESLLFDIRYALRQLRRQPTFAVVAILVLALGIGANTAVFSVVNTLLFQPLPFREPDRLAWLLNRDSAELTARAWEVSAYEALHGLQTLEAVTTYEAFFARGSFKLSRDAEPERVVGVMIPADFFPFLGIAPMLGRTFTADECRRNGPGAVILSHRLWERRYSSDPNVIGRETSVNDRAATIVGVMPPAFDFAAVFAPGVEIDIFAPADLEELRDWGPTMTILARVRHGVSFEAAQAEVTERLIEQLKPRRPERFQAIVRPLRQSITGDMRRPMFTLWAAVGIVLLIVCVNLSNLLLARSASRRREMALRGAIGAGYGRLARQLLTESLVLSSFGGALGILFAYLAVRYVRGLEGLSIPLLNTVQIDARALGVALGVTLATALLFGLAPAVSTARENLGAVLKSAARGSSEGRGHRSLRSWLVASEVSLACLLLVAAGLLLRSFVHVLDVNLGFQTAGSYALRIDPGPKIFDVESNYWAFMVRLASAARSVQGIEAAGITDALPFDSHRRWTVRPTDQPDERTGALLKIVGSGLLETMRTPLIAGRDFTDADDADSRRVALVNQTLADRLWPNQDPLTRALHVGSAEWQVVGVVADVRHLTVEESPGAEVYLPILQKQTGSPSLVVRTGHPFAEVAPALRATLAEVAPELPTSSFRPLQRLVDRAISPRRFLVSLLIAFAAVALALAAIGIYGVISYSVAQRTPEFGIRMALGATGRHVQSGVLGDTLRITLIGAAIGIAGAVALSSLLSSLLFGISSTDPWTYAGAITALLLVALAAGFIPAFRASRLSPMIALRAD